jgi:PilZ domain
MQIMEQLSKIGIVPAASSPAEKRRHPRFPFSSGGEAFDPQANVHVTGRLSDISRSGCYMDTISPFAVNAAIILTVTHEGRTFKTKAKVVYSLNGMGMGMMFTTMEPDQARVLDGWLAELGGLIHLEPNAAKPDAPEAVVEAAPVVDQELRDIVRELIVVLSRKSIVGDVEAMAMMRKLSK